MWPFEVLHVEGPEGAITSFPAHAHVGQPCPAPLRLLAAKGPRAQCPLSTGRRCAYRLRLTTSSLPGAACMGSVYLTMAGALGEAGPFWLPGTPAPPPPPPRPPADGPLSSAAPHYTPRPPPPSPRFAQGACDEFEVEGPDVGPLDEVELWQDAPLSSRGWHCARVEVTNLTTGQSGTFDCGRWVDRAPSALPPLAGEGVHRPRVHAHAERHTPAPDIAGSLRIATGVVTEAPGIPGGYEATLYTGRRAGAGTSSRVYVELVGTAATSGRLDLQRASSRSFTAGSIDVAGLAEVPWLGLLTHCRVGTDGTGLFAPWFLTCGRFYQ